MTKVLLDTDVVINILKKKEETLTFSSISDERCGIRLRYIGGNLNSGSLFSFSQIKD